MDTQPPVGAHEAPILRTKLYIPPIRPEWVSRPRLIERLDTGLQRKLTLVSAPAGFGKTTLVSEWITSHRRGGPRADGRDAVVAPGAPAGAMAAVPRPRGQASVPLQAAWLSLDEGDNDPTRFLTYLVAALQAAVQPLEVNVGQGALSALQSPQPPPAQAILTDLINELTALSCRIVLVLDDYHLIEAQPVHDALTFLLRHLPPAVGPLGGLHLVLVTREDPPLPLARLRARGQLAELRAADLRFTHAEAAAFLNQAMGLDLSAEDVAALEARTEGWIAGLHLAALAMQGPRQGREDASDFVRSFAGSHHFVLDYLVEEVLEQQPDRIQSFLLQTAALDRLTGPLCDAVLDRAGLDSAVTGQGDGQAILQMLEHANLFIVPLDEERRWYRYHRLFVDLLRQRLRQSQPELVPTLHQRASEWYEQNGWVDEAIEYALRAQEHERAARLIDAHVDEMWVRGEHGSLRRWLDQMPIQQVLSRPQLAIVHAWYLFARGRHGAAEQALGGAERALQDADTAVDDTPVAGQGPPGQVELPQADRTKLRGEAAVIRAFMCAYQGDVPGIIRHAQRALVDLPGQASTWRSVAAITLGDAQAFRGDMPAARRAYLDALEACQAAGDLYFPLVVNLKLANTLRAQGRLQETSEICRQQIQSADTQGLSRTLAVACLLAIWGETLAELGDLEGALERAKRGVELAERGGDMAMLGWSYICLVRVLFSTGDLAGAHELVFKTQNLARESSMPPWIVRQMGTWQARTWLVQGELDAASQWARDRGLDVDGAPRLPQELDFFGLFEQILLARILLAQGRPEEASDLLHLLLEPAEAGGRTTRLIEIRMLQASAFHARGERDRAMEALESALALAAPNGFFQIWIDEGPPMARLLYQAATRGVMPDYTGKLLAAFPAADAPPEIAVRPAVGTQTSKSDIRGQPAVGTEILEPLSARELEVLELFAQGLTNQEIASRLFLALNTVKAHSRNIYGKLGVHSRTRAVAKARALGLLSSP